MQKNEKISVIIAAAGSSSRFGKNISKQFILFCDKPLLVHSLEKFAMLENVIEIIIATNDLSSTNEILKKYCSNYKVKIQAVSGGELRQDSVYNAFSFVNSAVDLVLIHDVARPLFDIRAVQKCIEKAQDTGAAILAVPVVDTLKKARSNNDELLVEGASSTLERGGLYLVQTPQVISYDLLCKAYNKYRSASNSNLLFTDEARMVELLGKPVNLVIGSRKNIKITYPEDLEIASAILKTEKLTTYV